MPKLEPMNSLLLLLLALALPLPAAAAVDETALLRCRALNEAAARLACYDALLPLAPVLAPASVPVPAPVPVAAPPPAAVPTTSVAAFGLDVRRDELPEIASSLPGHFEGWGPRTQFKLANGQVWRVSDDSSGVYNLDNPKVRVVRAALGSYMLEIEGARRAPRVKRVE